VRQNNPVIYGEIKTSAGIPLAGVTLVFSNGGGSTTTDANGRYSLMVNAGWSGAVTPAKTNFSFTPSNRSYSNVSADKGGENFAAISTLVTISGSVRTPAGDGIQGLTVTLSNGQGSVTTDADGNYACQIPAGWSGTITPNPGDTPFSPSSRSITNAGNLTGLDFTRLDTPTISGQVKTSDGLPVEGVKMIFSNGGGTTMTDADGNYSMTVRYGWNGVATPANVGFVFTPTRHIYRNVTLDRAGENFAGKSLMVIRHK